MKTIKTLLALFLISCSNIHAQFPTNDSIEKAVYVVERYIERNGLSMELLRPNAKPEFFFLVCHLDSTGQINDTKFFFTDSSVHASFYKQKILPGIKQSWKPVKSKFNGFIVPIFIFPGDCTNPERDRYFDIEFFFRRQYYSNKAESTLYLAEDVIVSYTH